MEYVFGYEDSYGEVLKVKDKENVILNEGRNIVEREYGDQNITDGFFVEKRIRYKEDSAGNKYAWYKIKNHYRYCDKFKSDIMPTEQEITDLEIESIEQDQSITDLEIAVLELQEG